METLNAVYEYGYAVQMVALMAFGIAFLLSKFKPFHK